MVRKPICFLPFGLGGCSIFSIGWGIININITDIITNVIGDDTWVVWRIFWEPLNVLTSEI
jgi:hypothetical protein